MEDEAIGDYVDAAAAVIGLPIRAERRPGVVDNLKMILGQSAGLLALRLGDDEEFGPIFHP